MAERSKIEWTDATWNPIRARERKTGKVGWHCELHSPGCTNCYAQALNGRKLAIGTGLPYTRSSRDKVDIFLDIDTLREPLRWKKPRMVFVCSMTDLFGEWVTDQQIDQVFAVMNACLFTLPVSEKSKRWHTFHVLTKRSDRMLDYMQSRASKNFRQGKHPLFEAGRGEGGALRGCGREVMNAGAVLSWPPPNVWLGVSVEDQTQADKRIPELLQTPAEVRFLSCEPLLGPIQLPLGDEVEESERREVGLAGCGMGLNGAGIDWLIVGGESGPGARSCEVAWVRDLRDQCAEAGVPCFVKQLGSHCLNTVNTEDGPVSSRVRLRDGKGGDWDEWPEDLRVREFPSVEAVRNADE